MLFICWCNFLAFISQADVGWLSVNVTKSLRAFVERVNANFRDKNVVFLQSSGNRQFVVVKGLL